MIHAGHKKVVCSCGAVITQCRCPAPDKEIEIVQDGCRLCSGSFAKTNALSGSIPMEPMVGDTTVDALLAPPREVTISVIPLVVPEASPPLRAWQVAVATAGSGEWRETFGSRDALDAFVRGVRAGAAARGCFDVEVVE